MSSIPNQFQADAIPVEPRRAGAAPGKIGIWLFIASEVMFFAGLLGSYVLFRAADPVLFSAQSAALNKILGGLNTAILISSSFAMSIGVKAARKGLRGKMIICLVLAVLAACAFLGITAVEYNTQLSHYTMIAKNAQGNAFVYDGQVRKDGDVIDLTGFAAPMPADNSWDIHLLTERQVRNAAERAGAGSLPVEHKILDSSIIQQINYGPSKNMFFASFFTLTAMHSLHVLGGIIALMVLLIQAARGKLLPAVTEYTGDYWYFVDAVWIFIYVMLYLI